MKQPRTSDFDPNAHQNPHETGDGLTSLKSSMDDFPAIETPNQRQHPGGVLNVAPPVRDVRDVLDLSPAPAAPVGARRKIKSRHPFDIYEDQVDELKKLSVEDRMRGGSGSMSAMVREAIDDYITKARA